MARWRNRILEGCTLLGGLAVLAQLWSPARRFTRQAWRTLYPAPLLAILAVGVVVLIGATLAMRRNAARLKDELAEAQQRSLSAEDSAEIPGAGEAARQRNEDVFARIRAHIPREAIEWLRRFDFGGSWAFARSEPFLDIEDRLVPIEHRFASDDLEAARVRLFEAVELFGNGLATLSGPSSTQDGRYNVMDKRDMMSSPAAEDLWLERKLELNRLADQVVERYDELATTAQRHHIY